MFQHVRNSGLVQAPNIPLGKANSPKRDFPLICPGNTCYPMTLTSLSRALVALTLFLASTLCPLGASAQSGAPEDVVDVELLEGVVVPAKVHRG